MFDSKILISIFLIHLCFLGYGTGDEATENAFTDSAKEIGANVRNFLMDLTPANRLNFFKIKFNTKKTKGEIKEDINGWLANQTQKIQIKFNDLKSKIIKWQEDYSSNITKNLSNEAIELFANIRATIMNDSLTYLEACEDIQVEINKASVQARSELHLPIVATDITANDGKVQASPKEVCNQAFGHSVHGLLGGGPNGFVGKENDFGAVPEEDFSQDLENLDKMFPNFTMNATECANNSKIMILPMLQPEYLHSINNTFEHIYFNLNISSSEEGDLNAIDSNEDTDDFNALRLFKAKLPVDYTMTEYFKNLFVIPNEEDDEPEKASEALDSNAIDINNAAPLNFELIKGDLPLEESQIPLATDSSLRIARQIQTNGLDQLKENFEKSISQAREKVVGMENGGSDFMNQFKNRFTPKPLTNTSNATTVAPNSSIKDRLQNNTYINDIKDRLANNSYINQIKVKIDNPNFIEEIKANLSSNAQELKNKLSNGIQEIKDKLPNIPNPMNNIRENISNNTQIKDLQIKLSNNSFLNEFNITNVLKPTNSSNINNLLVQNFTISPTLLSNNMNELKEKFTNIPYMPQLPHLLKNGSLTEKMNPIESSNSTDKSWKHVFEVIHQQVLKKLQKPQNETKS